jgi:hypothetical protein
MNSLSLSNLQINDYSSPSFGATLGGIDENGKKIDVLHVYLDENGKPSINDWSHGGKSYHLKECNSKMIPDFRTLLEKNLVILYNFYKHEMLAFSGFDKYGKISKHSQFCGSTLHEYSYSSLNIKYKDTKVAITSFKMMDKKTSEYVKKTLMDIAWWFDKAPNDTFKRQYEVIPRNYFSNNITQSAQSTFSQTTSVPSRTKTLPTLPPQPITNTSSSTIQKTITTSSIISNSSTNTFVSLADFQGNNFENDSDSPPEQLLKTAIDLAKKEGFTKFAISTSFTKNIEVYPEPYLSKTNKTFHQLKVDFFIDASNNFGKSCQLILQREFFIASSDKTIVIQRVTECANAILNKVSITASTQV